MEVLVAFVIGTLMAMALFNLFGSMMRVASSTQNDVVAGNIVRKLQSYFRNCSYGFVQSRVGQVYSLDPGKEYNDVLVDPIRSRLHLDVSETTRDWQNASISGKFNGNVNCSILNGPVPDSVKIMISVTWSDSLRTQSKTLVRNLVLSKNGLGGGN